MFARTTDGSGQVTEESQPNGNAHVSLEYVSNLAGFRCPSLKHHHVSSRDRN